MPGYPISAGAREVAAMEAASKCLPGKNAVTLLEDGCFHMVKDASGEEAAISDGTYGWQEFQQEVLGEKYRAIHDFFEISDERGNNFLYNLLELIRNQSEKIFFARYVYILSRLEPGKDAAPEQQEAYRDFSAKMYRWIKCGRDCRQLKTAMALYVYVTREKEAARDESE